MDKNELINWIVYKCKDRYKSEYLNALSDREFNKFIVDVVCPILKVEHEETFKKMRART